MKIKKNLIAVAGLLTTSALISAPKQKQQPNIVIFFVDDLGYYNLGYRNSKFHTPNIDLLAKQSVEFANAYTASPTSSPSRASLYTGKHPAGMQFYRHCNSSEKEFNMCKTDIANMPSRNWMPLEHITYAEVLKKHNYKTFFVGKWHLGGEKYGPSKQGFDIVISNPYEGHPKSYYPDYYRNKKFSDQVNKAKYLTDFFTDKTVDYINDYKSEDPFLIQFSYQNVHTPNVGKKEFVSLYKKRGFKGKLAEFGAQITAVDQSVGIVMNALKKKGVLENTIVMFISYQGSFYPNTPLRGTKHRGTALYEGSSKIPFFIKWPGIEPRKEKMHIQTVDVFPTIVELVGENCSNYSDLEGQSLLKNIYYKKSLNRDALYFYRSYDEQYAAVLTSDSWKIVAYRGEKYELFKVDEDISESNDLSKKYPGKLEELAKMLSEWENKTIVNN
jgi:arylsulfatase A-like enzyme